MNWRVSFTYLAGNTLEEERDGTTILKGTLKEILEWIAVHPRADDFIEIKIREITEQVRNIHSQTTTVSEG